MRLVVDTNIVASGLLWHGPSRRLMDLARSGEVALFTSAPLLDELARILARDRFRRKLQELSIDREELVLGYAELANVIAPALIGEVIKKDPSDDHVLACALAAGADLIVSGDPHLQNLKHYHRMPIVRDSEALRRIEQALRRDKA